MRAFVVHGQRSTVRGWGKEEVAERMPWRQMCQTMALEQRQGERGTNAQYSTIPRARIQEYRVQYQCWWMGLLFVFIALAIFFLPHTCSLDSIRSPLLRIAMTRMLTTAWVC